MFTFKTAAKSAGSKTGGWQQQSSRQKRDRLWQCRRRVCKLTTTKPSTTRTELTTGRNDRRQPAAHSSSSSSSSFSEFAHLPQVGPVLPAAAALAETAQPAGVAPSCTPYARLNGRPFCTYLQTSETTGLTFSQTPPPRLLPLQTTPRSRACSSVRRHCWPPSDTAVRQGWKQ